MKKALRNAHPAATAVAVFAAGAVIGGFLLPARPARSQSAPAAKTAGEVFKNVQVLKDIPANQLIPSMQFISTSLGVRCGFCHVEGAFYKDTKRTKLTARHMIQMELAINKENFDGRTEVTCYTSHRGLPHPVGVPVIAQAPAANPGGEMHGEGQPHPAGPSVDQILAKFVEASGGATAIQQVSSRTLTGVVSGPRMHSAAVKISEKAPGRQHLSIAMGDHEMVRVYNGSEGWETNGGQRARPLSGAELEATKLDADLHLALNLRQHFANLRPIRPETINGREAYGLIGFNPGQPPVRFYFDSQSGLLARIETLTATPLGDTPFQVDYSDYRKADGVAAPYHETLASPEATFTLQFSEIQQNAAVNDDLFTKPAGAPAQH